MSNKRKSQYHPSSASIIQAGEEEDESKGQRLHARRLALLGVLVLGVFVVSVFVLSLSPSHSAIHSHRSQHAPRIKSHVKNGRDNPFAAEQKESLEIKQPEECCQDDDDAPNEPANLEADPNPLSRSIEEFVQKMNVPPDSSAPAVPDSEGRIVIALSVIFFLSIVRYSGCLHAIPESHFTGTHIVAPPEGDVTIVCCQSTKGPLNIAVHKDWAPLGAER